jgi:hypothetical protein
MPTEIFGTHIVKKNPTAFTVGFDHRLALRHWAYPPDPPLDPGSLTFADRGHGVRGGCSATAKPAPALPTAHTLRMWRTLALPTAHTLRMWMAEMYYGTENGTTGANCARSGAGIDPVLGN